MTRMLSELLGAEEPNFRLSLRELEKTAGHPSEDIRLSVDILHSSYAKIRELGLDPGNTTAEELFAVLKQRLLADEQRLRDSLGFETGSNPKENLPRLERFINSLNLPKTCFALKHSVAKKLLKKIPPRKAMKILGYRSLDSMLKHEPVPQIFAAASIYESSRWFKELHEAYEKLGPSDFETRKISVVVPKTKRWQSMAADFVESRRHNSLAFKELGAIVLMPDEADLPALFLVTTLLSIKSINDIRCASSFLKLQQVRPDFGKLVALCTEQMPFTEAELSGFKLPWHFLHEFFSGISETYSSALLEPHVQPEDLQLASAEKALSEKLPALEFWLGTDKLAMVENGQPVSLNMLDVALATANDLPLNQSVVGNVREKVWTELLRRYLNPDNLERVTQQLSSELTGGELMPALEMETL